MEGELNRRKYHTIGIPNSLRAKNAVFISTQNSLKHELAKLLGGYMVRKYGDIKFNEDILLCLLALENCVNDSLEGFPKNPKNFITEACPNEEKDRRVDLVILEDNTRIEFESDHKIKKADNPSGEATITIYI